METMGVLIFHLVSTHAVTVEKAYFLILLPPHVVHTLVGLHISDLGKGGGVGNISNNCKNGSTKPLIWTRGEASLLSTVSQSPFWLWK